MKPSIISRRIDNQYRLVGPLLWVASIQYFVTQVFVARAWQVRYSLSANTISDLGNTSCRDHASLNVCSPRYALMNISFVILGICMMSGAALIYSEFKTGRFGKIGFGLIALAGLGTVIVGLVPENVMPGLHAFGATLPFLFGNIGVLLLGIKLQLPKIVRMFTIVCGIIALIGLALFKLGAYLGLGLGGMERVTAYPQTIWLIFFGIYIAVRQYRSRK
jgi:hypothetical membrane protein